MLIIKVGLCVLAFVLPYPVQYIAFGLNRPVLGCWLHVHLNGPGNAISLHAVIAWSYNMQQGVAVSAARCTSYITRPVHVSDEHSIAFNIVFSIQSKVCKFRKANSCRRLDRLGCKGGF